MAGLSLAGVGKSFGTIRAVAGVDLAMAPGEVVAVLGPSGCGKTTLLRLIAGFEHVDEGEIAHDGMVLSAPGHHVPAERRGIGIVFQSHALWPQMSVARNVAYPLEVRGVPRAERVRRVAAALERVGLAGSGERHPAELSGGQRQRVALARCLVMETRLVLLDEPLASLDPHLRLGLQDAFDDFRRATGAAMLYITHDQGEAMALADRVAVMERGRLVQLAPPAQLYREPASAMVAGFVGKGGIVACRITGDIAEGRAAISLLGYRATVRCPPAHPPGPARLFLRPEDLRPAARNEPGFAARVRRLRYLGAALEAELAPQGQEDSLLVMQSPFGTGLALGSELRIAIADGWIIPPE